MKLNYSNPLPTTRVTFLKNITIDKTNYYRPETENCGWKK
jgi:hypothetical protein